MKATGIVRRIDDLGRVVVPKEIRKTMKIREGDSLEIFAGNEDEIILKKYSAIAELGGFAGEYAEALYKASEESVLIVDKDHVIGAAGVKKKDFEQQPISEELERVMNERIPFVADEINAKPIEMTASTDPSALAVQCSAQLIVPIISNGDVIGAVILFSTKSGKAYGDTEKKLAQTAATFFGTHLS